MSDRGKYEIPIGTGAGFDLLIDCTPQQRACIDSWLRNQGFIEFLMTLRDQTKPLTPGEVRKKDCGCGS